MLTVEAEAIPQQNPRQTEAIHDADLVVGIFGDLDHDTIAQICDALRGLPGPLRIVMLRTDEAGEPVRAAK